MATEAAADDAADAPEAYDALLDRVRRWNAVGSAAACSCGTNR